MALKLGSNIDLDKVIKGLGNKYKLVPHLEKVIGESEFAWTAEFSPKLPDTAWHPSGDCTPSLHDLWLKATGNIEPRPFTSAVRKTFMVGHFWHAYLQWIVQKKLEFASPLAIERRGEKVWRYLTEESNTAAPYGWAAGSADIAPCTIPGHGDYIIDFKTINSRMFTTGPPEDVLAKWECQGNIYMDLFNIDRILFVGIQKDFPHDMKEWEFERNRPLVDAIYRKWELVSECLVENVAPPEDEAIDLPLKGPIAC